MDIPQPRYSKSEQGTIKDRRTGLEWFVGPDHDLMWDEAWFWIRTLSEAGGGWRMPDLNELSTLYQDGLRPLNIDPLFELTGWGVWSREADDDSSAYYFNFTHGVEYWSFRSRSFNLRAIAVR